MYKPIPFVCFSFVQIVERTNNISVIIDILREANFVLRFAPYLTGEDVRYTASIAELSVRSGIEGVYPLDRSIGKEVVKLADKLLDLDTSVLQEADEACLRFVDSYC